MLGQHGGDAVGEVGRVAAPVGFTIQRRAYAHIGGDVGDGHDDPPSAVAVGLGVDCVVVVARVFRIDGDQRDACQVLARRLRRPGLVGFLDHRFREFIRHAVGVHGDNGGRARIIQPADDFNDVRPARAIAAGGARLDAHDVAILRVAGGALLVDEL